MKITKTFLLAALLPGCIPLPPAMMQAWNRGSVFIVWVPSLRARPARAKRRRPIKHQGQEKSAKTSISIGHP